MKSNTRKKILALFAAGALAVTGTAWAVTESTTIPTTPASDADAVSGSVSAYYLINGVNQGWGGTGSLTGQIFADSTAGAGATEFYANIRAATGGQLAYLPSAGNMFGAINLPGAGNAVDPAAGNGNLNQFRVTVNAARTDAGESASTGTVLMNGGNGNTPVFSGTDAEKIYNNYRHGTYVEHGTLAVTNYNSVGLGGIALVGDANVVPVLKIQETDSIVWGEERSGVATNQPLVLTRNLTRATAAGTVKAEVNVHKVGDNLQRMTFLDGGWQAATNNMDADRRNQGYDTAAAAASGIAYEAPAALRSTTGDARPAYPLDIDGATSAPEYFAGLVKTGDGILYFKSDANKVAWTGATTTIGTATGSYPGLVHFGGTEVTGGTLDVDGGNAVTNRDRYKGQLGWAWQDNDPDATYFANTVYATGISNTLLHQAPAGFADTMREHKGAAAATKIYNNPLTITNNGEVIVNRSQVYTFFRGTENTAFEANQFTQSGTNLRPEIHVRLARQHSNFDGMISGSFDLVLDSMESVNNGDANDTMWNRPTRTLAHIAQATLTLGNADNDIMGTTLVTDGVLAVAGQDSIGRMSLQVGKTNGGNDGSVVARTEGGSLGVFLGLGDATFTLPTRVESQYTNPPRSILGALGEIQANEWGAPIFNQTGALAAANSVTTTYSDVTIDGGIEINPRVVATAFNFDNTNFVWDNANPYTYPTWMGTVAFGMGEGTYNMTGNTNAHTRWLISRGTLHLGKLPEAGFGEMRIRQSAVLSLGQDVNDFSDYLDVVVEDDSRVKVIVRQSDIANSRAEAMANEALFSARNIDYTLLGSGSNNKDRRLNIQLDLGNVSNQLKKGQWIKLVYSEEANNWNNLHYLREWGDTQYEDYAKVRLTYMNNTDLLANAIAHVDQNSNTILLECITDTGEDPVVETNFTFTNTTAANSLIEGSVNLADASIGNVASADVTVYLFHGGVSTTDNANAIANVSGVTNSSGTMAYSFTPDADGFGYSANYILKAVSAGYKDGTRSITTDAGDIIWSDSSSGCDAGFGIFALIAAAGGALVLRKKD